MKARRKIAIYIDYAIRVPNFISAFEALKAELFSDKDFDIDVEDEIQPEDPRFYWKEQMKKQEIETFYMNTLPPKDNMDTRKDGFEKYFFNKEHYYKFLDEYSFNLYTDAQIPNSQDVDVINVAQEQLFDVVLVDECLCRRKKSNTCFYLSKLRVYPQQILFLSEGQQLNKDNYFAVWNPLVDDSQVNKPKDKSFIEWFKNLESKQKELDNE